VLIFNAEKVFKGTVIVDICGRPTDNVDDIQPLIYKMSLAAPYTPSGDGHIKEKWSGTNQAGDNSGQLGIVMDVFTHHSLIDSGYTTVIVDLQGMSPLAYARL
jgi:hypothetical protein